MHNQILLKVKKIKKYIFILFTRRNHESKKKTFHMNMRFRYDFLSHKQNKTNKLLVKIYCLYFLKY